MLNANIHIQVQTPNLRISTWSQKQPFIFECSDTSLNFVSVFVLAVELWRRSGGTDRHWSQCPHQTSTHLTQWELHSECEYRWRYPALEVPQSSLITINTSVVSRGTMWPLLHLSVSFYHGHNICCGDVQVCLFILEHQCACLHIRRLYRAHFKYFCWS